MPRLQVTEPRDNGAAPAAPPPDRMSEAVQKRLASMEKELALNVLKRAEDRFATLQAELFAENRAMVREIERAASEMQAEARALQHRWWWLLSLLGSNMMGLLAAGALYGLHRGMGLG